VIGIVVATYGDREKWAPLAQRAMASTVAQRGHDADFAATWVHGETLAEARNEGAAKHGSERPLGQERTTHFIFLDGDDTLDAGYVAAMQTAADRAALMSDTPWHLLRPATIGVHPDGTTDDAPVMIPLTDMRTTNCCVIGTMVPADLFWQIGGFEDWPALEDWALYRRLVAAGANIVDVPDAIYEVHVGGSRNVPSKVMNETYRRIRKQIPL
jgi:GT2 family glycosyltransferase